MISLQLNIRFLLTAFLLSCPEECAAEPKLKLEPKAFNLSIFKKTAHLLINCISDQPQLKLQEMKIRWKKHGDTDDAAKDLLSTAPIGTTLSPEGKTLPLALHGGSRMQSMIYLIFQADCRHEGVYICVETINNTNKMSEDSLKVNVLLGNVTMTPIPGDGRHPLGSRLKLTCLAGIGRDDMGVEWKWQYKVPGGSFQDLDPQTTDRLQVTTKPSTQDAAFPCQRLQESVLELSVTVEDLDRQYRCFIQRGKERSSTVGSYQVPGVELTFDPTKRRLSENERYMNIMVMCALQFQPQLQALEISRKVRDEEQFYVLISGDRNGTTTLWPHAANLTDVSHSARLNDNFITLNFTAGCEDAVVYRCCARLYGNSSNTCQERDLTFQVPLGAVTLTADKVQVKEGDTLRLTCEGKVGHDSTIIRWVWQYREPGQDKFHDTAGLENVTVETSDSRSDESFLCQNIQTSTLTLNVSERDTDGRTYRCFPTLNATAEVEQHREYGYYKFPFVNINIHIKLLSVSPRVSVQMNCSCDHQDLKLLEIIRGSNRTADDQKMLTATRYENALTEYSLEHFFSAERLGSLSSHWVAVNFTAHCPEDEGLYMCCAYWNQSSSKCSTKKLTFAAWAATEAVQVIAVLSNSDSQNPQMNLSCSATVVGSSSLPLTWVWQSRYGWEEQFRNLSEYAYTINDTLSLQKDCHWTATSILPHKVRMDDYGLRYRCFLRIPGETGEPTKSSTFEITRLVAENPTRSGASVRKVKGAPGGSKLAATGAIIVSVGLIALAVTYFVRVKFRCRWPTRGVFTPST